MRVLFAPDYREGTPYQTLLADALGRLGVKVSFLSDYHRGLPICSGGCARGCRDIVARVTGRRNTSQQRGDPSGLAAGRTPIPLIAG